MLKKFMFCRLCLIQNIFSLSMYFLSNIDPFIDRVINFFIFRKMQDKEYKLTRNHETKLLWKTIKKIYTNKTTWTKWVKVIKYLNRSLLGCGRWDMNTKVDIIYKTQFTIKSNNNNSQYEQQDIKYDISTTRMLIICKNFKSVIS